MVAGSVTDTVVAPGTARRAKPLMRSWVVLMPTAPQRKAAVSPSAATTAATQYPTVEGRLLARRDGIGGRVGGGRRSVIEEVMCFASCSSLLHSPPELGRRQEPEGPDSTGPLVTGPLPG